jgi:hypothetical protein
MRIAHPIQSIVMLCCATISIAFWGLLVVSCFLAAASAVLRGNIDSFVKLLPLAILFLSPIAGILVLLPRRASSQLSKHRLG